jgi:hypothetical protein
MSQPFSGVPDPGAPRPFKRRFQPSVVQDMLRSALPTARRHADTAIRAAKRHGQDLWYRGKRHPRIVGGVAGAIAVTFVGAYALSASGAGQSLCPKGLPKTQFLLLVDPVLNQAAGSEVDIHYDVCGLSSGTPYRGRVQLSQQKPAGKTGKKKSPKPRALVATFRDKVDGVATRRSQPLDLTYTKPGSYTLELTVVDNQGRERKRAQKIVVTPK